MHRLKWFGFWTLLGLVSGAQLHLANQRFAVHPPSWWLALATGLSHWYLWGLLALVVAWLGRRFQVDRASFGRHFFIHLGASLDLALLQLVAAVGVQDLLHAAAAILAVVHALDYHADLEQHRVHAAVREVRHPAERLLVADNGRSFFVRTSDVDWMEAARNYVRLHVGDRTHLLRATLGALEQRLDPERFRRISRSALVNLDRVREVQPWFHGDAVVILEGGARLALSRRFRDNLLGAPVS